MELAKELWDEYLNESDFRKGEILGECMFGVVSLAVPYAKAGQVANAGKLDFLTDLRGFSLFQRNPRAMAALDRTVEKVEQAGLICFAAGTQVHTPDGLKSIEQIQRGDFVLARDPLRGHQTFKPVVQTFVTHPDRLYHLRYRAREASGDDPDPLLVCTGTHPFFVPSLGRFVPADELAIGSDLQLADGRIAEITSITTEDAPAGELFTTYNFEVADYHTYFVGEAGVWVHNAALGSRICSRFDSHFKKALRAGKNEWQAFEEAVGINGTATGGNVGQLAEKVMNKMLRLDSNDQLRYPVGEFPTVEQMNLVLKGRKGRGTRTSPRGRQYSGVMTEVHHTVPKHAVDDLLKKGKLQNVSSVDDVPGLPVGYDGHTGANGLHSFIDAELAAIPGGRPYEDPVAVRNALARGYRSANRDDLAKLIEAWFDIHLVP